MIPLIEIGRFALGPAASIDSREIGTTDPFPAEPQRDQIVEVKWK